MNLYIILTVVVVLFVIVRRVRRFMVTLVPPSRVHLELSKPSRKHAEDVGARGRELESRGFTRIGTYRVDPIAGLLLTAFTHAEHSLCAIVYTHPMAGTFMDIVVKNDAGRSLTVTTAPIGKELDQREGHEKVFDKDMPVATMIETAMQRRPPAPHVRWSAGNFVAKFEEAYAQEMDWRAGRGGVTRDEVRRVADATGRKYSEQDIHTATRKFQRHYAESRRDVR
jgi:hypothetical protein